jgi:protein transport protein SEC24
MNMVDKIRELRMYQNSCSPQTYLVKEDGDPGMKMWFLSHLVQDRFDNVMSYHQYISSLRDEISKISV